MSAVADLIKVIKRDSSNARSHLSLNSKEGEKSRKMTFEEQPE